MTKKSVLKKVSKTIALYGIQIWVMLFVANIAAITFIRFKAQAQSCMTQTQINSDSRCLYVLSGNIYSKGSRSKPHKGHPCGMNVTSIIPSFHINTPSKYLLPNFVGPVCSGNVNPTASPVPTATRTATATAAPTRTATTQPTTAPTLSPTNPPTNPPTQLPTNAPSQPTGVPTRTPTLRPGTTKTASPIPTKTPTTPPNLAYGKTPTPVPTIPPEPSRAPQPPSLLFSIMASLMSQSPSPDPLIGNNNPDEGNQSSLSPDTGTETVPTKNEGLDYALIYWTTILSYISFAILIGTGVLWLVQKIRHGVKSQTRLPIPTPPSVK